MAFLRDKKTEGQYPVIAIDTDLPAMGGSVAVALMFRTLSDRKEAVTRLRENGLDDTDILDYHDAQLEGDTPERHTKRECIMVERANPHILENALGRESFSPALLAALHTRWEEKEEDHHIPAAQSVYSQDFLLALRDNGMRYTAPEDAHQPVRALTAIAAGHVHTPRTLLEAPPEAITLLTHHLAPHLPFIRTGILLEEGNEALVVHAHIARTTYALSQDTARNPSDMLLHPQLTRHILSCENSKDPYCRTYHIPEQDYPVQMIRSTTPPEGSAKTELLVTNSIDAQNVLNALLEEGIHAYIRYNMHNPGPLVVWPKNLTADMLPPYHEPEGYFGEEHQWNNIPDTEQYTEHGGTALEDSPLSPEKEPETHHPMHGTQHLRTLYNERTHIILANSGVETLLPLISGRFVNPELAAHIERGERAAQDLWQHRVRTPENPKEKGR